MFQSNFVARHSLLTGFLLKNHDITPTYKVTQHSKNWLSQIFTHYMDKKLS